MRDKTKNTNDRNREEQSKPSAGATVREKSGAKDSRDDKASAPNAGATPRGKKGKK